VLKTPFAEVEVALHTAVPQLPLAILEGGNRAPGVGGVALPSLSRSSGGSKRAGALAAKRHTDLFSL
jgi:hypothetical protein